MEQFDITCTATLRPELLRRTFESHKKYLFGSSIQKARLIINIDMVGTNCPKQSQDALSEIFDFIHSMNFYTVSWNIGLPGNFAKAWFWCMNQLDISKPIFFNLEEDWEMVRPVNFEEMYDVMVKNPIIAHLRLSQFPSTINRLKNWNKFLSWNGTFFEVNSDEAGTIGWCGHPGLTRTKFMMECLLHMDKEKNPEKQIKHHNPKIREIIDKSVFGCWHEQDCPAAIIDIGREWMVKHGWVKAGSKAFFTTWERTD
jgi:hypothetical protein